MFTHLHKYNKVFWALKTNEHNPVNEYNSNILFLLPLRSTTYQRFSPTLVMKASCNLSVFAGIRIRSAIPDALKIIVYFKMLISYVYLYCKSIDFEIYFL